jgi:hypothetical protein
MPSLGSLNARGATPHSEWSAIRKLSRTDFEEIGALTTVNTITLPPSRLLARNSFRIARRPSKKRDRKAPITLMGRTTDADCCYAAACSSASKLQSQQGACLAKVEPRAPRHERRRVAVADVAEKIRFHMPFREKLLLARLTFARRKELLIEFCVIKA